MRINEQPTTTGGSCTHIPCHSSSSGRLVFAGFLSSWCDVMWCDVMWLLMIIKRDGSDSSSQKHAFNYKLWCAPKFHTTTSLGCFTAQLLLLLLFFYWSVRLVLKNKCLCWCCQNRMFQVSPLSFIRINVTGAPGRMTKSAPPPPPPPPGTIVCNEHPQTSDPDTRNLRRIVVLVTWSPSYGVRYYSIVWALVLIGVCPDVPGHTTDTLDCPST